MNYVICEIYIYVYRMHPKTSAFRRNGRSFPININYSTANKLYFWCNCQRFTEYPKFEYHFWVRNLKDKRVPMNNEKQTCIHELWLKPCHVNKGWQEHIMLLDEVSAFITWFDFIEIHGDKLKCLVTVHFFKSSPPQKQIKKM